MDKLSEDFLHKANHIEHGLENINNHIFNMLTGNPSLNQTAIYEAVPESCDNYGFFLNVFVHSFMLNNLALSMRNLEINPSSPQYFKKKLIMIRNQYKKDCNCPLG